MNALITGAGSGIGLSIVNELLNKGYTVDGISRNCPNVNINKNHFEKYTHYSLDLCLTDNVENFLDKNKNNYNLLIHCAGEYLSDSELTALKARKLFLKLSDLHAGSFIHLAYGLKGKIRKGGQIIGISSNLTYRVNTHSMCYASSKGSLDVICRYLANYVGPDVMVNSIKLGLVKTAMSSGVFEDDLLISEIIDKTPLKAIADPAMVAKQIIGFAETNVWITGQSITADGGNSLTW